MEALAGKNFDAESFGIRLGVAREQADLTQSDVSGMLGINPITLSRWERGVASPDFLTTAQLALLYGKPLEWFADPARPELARDFRSKPRKRRTRVGVPQAEPAPLSTQPAPGTGTGAGQSPAKRSARASKTSNDLTNGYKPERFLLPLAV